MKQMLIRRVAPAVLALSLVGGAGVALASSSQAATNFNWVIDVNCPGTFGGTVNGEIGRVYSAATNNRCPDRFAWQEAYDLCRQQFGANRVASAKFIRSRFDGEDRYQYTYACSWQRNP